jgi:formiminoglutamase
MDHLIGKPSLSEDPHWPRASSWLSGPHKRDGRRWLRVLGAPVSRGSLTPSRCDFAPTAIRHSLERFSTYDVVHATDVRHLGVEDLGDLHLEHLLIEEAAEPIARAVEQARIGADAVLVLGGDNSISRPALLGMADTLSRSSLLTFDAHLDLRHREQGLHNGNPVRVLLDDGLPGNNIIQIGIQSFSNSEAYFRFAQEVGLTQVPVEQIAERGIETIVRAALKCLASRSDAIYVNFDLDVLDSAFAPAPAGARPGGLNPLELRRAAYCCGLHPKVRVADLVELDPTRDHQDRTAMAAAACLLSFASGILERPRP